MNLLPSLHIASPVAHAALTIQEASSLVNDPEPVVVIQEAVPDQYSMEGVSDSKVSVVSGVSSIAESAGRLVSGGISGVESVMWAFSKPILSNGWVMLLIGLVLFGGLTYLILQFA